jgi:hypothetical protein
MVFVRGSAKARTFFGSELKESQAPAPGGHPPFEARKRPVCPLGSGPSGPVQKPSHLVLVRILRGVCRVRVRSNFSARFGPFQSFSSRLNMRISATAASNNKRISPRMICADCRTAMILSASIMNDILAERSCLVRKNELVVTRDRK